MSKLANFKIAITINILPSLIMIITDFWFAFFFVPFLFVFTSFVSMIIWFSLKPFQVVDKFKHIILITLMTSLSIYICVINIYNYTSSGRFERLLFSPVPSSINFIDSHGRPSMAGGYEIIVFTLSSVHLNLILKKEQFEQFNLKEMRTNSFYNDIVLQAKEYGITTTAMYLSGESSVDTLILLVNKEQNKVMLYRNRL